MRPTKYLRARFIITGAALAATSLVGAIAPPSASAHEVDSNLTFLATTMGGTEAQILSDAEAYAKSTNQNVATVLQAAVNEAQANGYSLHSESLKDKNSNAAPNNSGGTVGSVPLTAPRQAGDIFWSDSTTDHVGLYYDRTFIIEAPGEGKVSRKAPIANVTASYNHVKLQVNTTQTRRNAAAAYANNYLLGRSYNIYFAFNRKADGALNCSQLVWAAYYETTKNSGVIDLDGNGGPGVYPGDILRTTWVTRY
ncbi:hypothetical protein JT358_15330 [Micrococcales bacterium 31B]|nr:hypothetical protein [Micrococcales bacterium 31B]